MRVTEALTQLGREWREQAATLDRFDDGRGASILRRLAAQLDAALAQVQEEPLTIRQAAEVSGYSTDHLRHLVATGQIENAGRKGSPRIRRGDLPRKPPQAA